MSESTEADPELAGNGNFEYINDPETQHDDLLRHLHKAFALAIRSNATRLSDQFLDPFIDDLLLLDYKVEHAESEIEKRIILSALLPIKQRFKEIFDDFGHPDLQNQLDELLTRLGPLISRVPLKVGSWLFTIVRIDEEDFRMKLVFEDNADPEQVAAKACEAASERKLFSDTFTEAILKEKVLAALGGGPPYTCLTLRASSNKYPISTAPLGRIFTSTGRGHDSDSNASTAPESRSSKPSQGNMVASEEDASASKLDSDSGADTSDKHTSVSTGNLRAANSPAEGNAALDPSSVSVSAGSAGASTDNRAGGSGADDTRSRQKPSKTKRQTRPDSESFSLDSGHGGHHGESSGYVNCVNCYRVRQEIHEDMLSALIQAADKMETRNNRILREIFNPL